MKILYCHNNYYATSPAGQHYSAGQFSYDYWYPYIKVFGHLHVMGREALPVSEEESQKMNLSSGDNVSFSLYPNIVSPKTYLRKYRAIHEQIKNEVSASDAVIIRAVSDLAWITYKYARKMNKPIAMEMSACAWDSTWNHGNILGKLYAPLRYLRDKIITRHADYVLYVSHEFLPRRYPTNGEIEFASNVRITKSPNAVLDKRIERIKQTARSPENVVTIGLIGTLSHKLKGVKDALKAIEILTRTQNTKFHFRCLGPGNPQPYRKYAQELGIEDSVSFDGMVQSGDAVLQWLDDIDIYIQPSYQEGVPRATIEAMSRACPCIGSTAGGIPEIISDEWLHKPGDYKKLAALIAKMAADPETQLVESSKNFETSFHFVEEVLMPKRIAFWSAFSKFARTQKEP